MDDAALETFNHYAQLAAALPQGDGRLRFQTCSILNGDQVDQVFAITAPTGEQLTTVVKLAEMAPRVAAALIAVKAENDRLRAALAATSTPAVNAGG